MAAKKGLIGRAMRNEVTSKRVATIAGKALRDKNSSPREKTLAAEALTQVPPGGYGAKPKKKI